MRFGGASALVLLAAMLVATGGAAASAPNVATKPCHASITSVSAIRASHPDATVVVLGHCLGTGPKFLRPSAYYGPGHSGLDTLHCGTTSSPAMRIVDTTGARVWEAGVADNTSGPWTGACSNVNGLGLKYRYWSETAIVFDGFGNRLQACTSAGVALCSGDSLMVEVYNPSTFAGATYNLTAS